MKNLLKSIITTVLVAAILISGISVDTITATAKTTTGTFQNGGKVTLKPGDNNDCYRYSPKSNGKAEKVQTQIQSNEKGYL